VPAADEAAAVAVVGRGETVARAAVAVWEAGDAVVPIDDTLPAAARDELLERLRPTHVLDADGARRPSRSGVPVRAGVAAIVATSGTTGTPKGAELTHAGLHAMARGVSDRIGAGTGDRWLACVPMHRVAGLAIVARGWATGVPLTAHDRFDAEHVARSPRDERTTIVSLVPTALQRLLDAGAPLDAFRVVLLGGAACPPALRARANDAGVNVVTTYGMTETWGGFALDGIPIDGAQVRIAADGEVCVRGPMVMRGYRLAADDGIDDGIDDGWFATGDVGTFEQGRITIVDRKKDVVITGGVNVHPARVEAVLARHPAVADVGVVGTPDVDFGECVVAVVVPRDPAAPPALDELRSYARESLPADHLPRAVRYVDAIPRDSGGKVLRRLLRDG
jgi:O-succinylbenzoic acid--CoA ligase